MTYYNGPVSDHFDGVRFFNPGQDSTDRSSAEFLRWMLARDRVAWPKQVPSIMPALPLARSTGLRVTMVGHACVLIQLQGINLLVDPLWASRAGRVACSGRNVPTRRASASTICRRSMQC